METISLSSATEWLRTQGDGWAELRGKVMRAPRAATQPCRRRTAPTRHRGAASPPALPPLLSEGRQGAPERGSPRGERGRTALQPPAPPQAAQRCTAPHRRCSRPRRAAQGMRMPRRQPPRPLLLLSALLCAPASAFNLDEEKLTVYSGPPGSYFGYSVDFYIPDPST